MLNLSLAFVSKVPQNVTDTANAVRSAEDVLDAGEHVRGVVAVVEGSWKYLEKVS